MVEEIEKGVSNARKREASGGHENISLDCQDQPAKEDRQRKETCSIAMQNLLINAAEFIELANSRTESKIKL